MLKNFCEHGFKGIYSEIIRKKNENMNMIWSDGGFSDSVEKLKQQISSMCMLALLSLLNLSHLLVQLQKLEQQEHEKTPVNKLELQEIICFKLLPPSEYLDQKEDLWRKIEEETCEEIPLVRSTIRILMQIMQSLNLKNFANE